MFVKHNYGNLNSSKKFVRLNDEGLQYFKSSESTDPGNKCISILIPREIK